MDYYIRQVNGVKLAVIMFSLLCVSPCVRVFVRTPVFNSVYQPFPPQTPIPPKSQPVSVPNPSTPNPTA